MLEAPLILLGLTIFIILDLEGLNRIFDIVNVFYILLVLGIFALSGKRQQWYEDELELKLYQYKKRVEVSQRWQDKFAGTWTKFSRVNFYEFMIFNGAPSVAASLMKDRASSQMISIDEQEDWTIKIVAKGVPQIELPWIKVAKTEEEAETYHCKNPQGKAFRARMWFDEKTQTLRLSGDNDEKLLISQTREINEQGHLVMTATHTKQDGSSCSFTSYYKRTL